MPHATQQKVMATDEQHVRLLTPTAYESCAPTNVTFP